MISVRTHRARTIRTVVLVGMLAIGLVASVATRAFAQAPGTWTKNSPISLHFQ
jgi:hypothetical protein